MSFSSRRTDASSTGKAVTLAGLLLFVGGMASVPLLIRLIQSKPMISSEDHLTGSQVQRGVFMNTGSKDVGRDPDWNLQTRSWEGKRNYAGPGIDTEQDYIKRTQAQNDAK